MKTPREILLKEHAAMRPKLDALRQTVLTAKWKQGAKPQFDPLWLPLKLWQELFWSCRRVWLGLATAWVIILFLNLASHSGEERPLAKATPPPSPAMLAALREQRLLLAQLLGSATSSSPPARPQDPPRSEIAAEIQIG